MGFEVQNFNLISYLLVLSYNKCTIGWDGQSTFLGDLMTSCYHWLKLLWNLPLTLKQFKCQVDVMPWSKRFMWSIRTQTWQLVDLSPYKKWITTKWVYKVKSHANGTIEKLKARLMARGFQQRACENFEKTYTPIAKYNTLWTMIVFTSHNG